MIKRTDRLFDQAEELQREARRELAHHFGSSPDRPAADDSARRGRITRQRHK